VNIWGMPPKIDDPEEATQAFAAGNAAKQGDDHVLAIEWYTKGLEIAASVELKSALYVNRGFTYTVVGRYAEALHDGEECAFIRPSWARTYECQASALHGMGRVEEGDGATRLAEALALLKQDPKNQDSKLRVKEMREERRALQAKIQASEAAMASVQAAAVSEAVAATPHGHTSSAASVVTQKLIATAPPSYVPEASQSIFTPRQLSSDDTTAATDIIVQGNALLQQQDYESALACYTKALDFSREPDLVSTIYFNCSIANSHLLRFHRALEDAEECIRNNPMWVQGFECKGTALEVVAKLPHTSSRKPFASAIELYVFAKEPYVFAKEPCVSGSAPIQQHFATHLV